MGWDHAKTFWPNAEASQFIEVTHRWHVQIAGDGPPLILIHGAGGATQSWRDIFPILAQTHRVIAMDLPGQGFTKMVRHRRCGLEAMSSDICSLLDHLGIERAGYVTHSAGSAIGLHIAERFPHRVSRVVAMNAALGKFEGMAGWLFPMAAKLLAAAPGVAWAFTQTGGSEANVKRLLQGTGSNVTEEMLRLYGYLINDVDHVRGTLRMMADWSLDGLITRLPRNTVQTDFFVGANDSTVPPNVSERAAGRMPNANLHVWGDLGHLAHEEAAPRVADDILKILQ